MPVCYGEKDRLRWVDQGFWEETREVGAGGGNNNIDKRRESWETIARMK